MNAKSEVGASVVSAESQRWRLYGWIGIGFAGLMAAAAILPAPEGAKVRIPAAPAPAPGNSDLRMLTAEEKAAVNPDVMAAKVKWEGFEYRTDGVAGSITGGLRNLSDKPITAGVLIEFVGAEADGFQVGPIPAGAVMPFSRAVGFPNARATSTNVKVVRVE